MTIAAIGVIVFLWGVLTSIREGILRDRPEAGLLRMAIGALLVAVSMFVKGPTQ